jgi:UDP-N-acetylmuramoyl-tripeptide--D-alanyl-D-alanine ligase
VPGTEVFVAEMGAYKPREIRALCEWCTPSISTITAIGPVHLERFGSEDNIVVAKSEIFERAATAILNVDDERLAAVADQQAAAGKRVVRCSSAAWKQDAVDVIAHIDADQADQLVVVTRGVELCRIARPDGTGIAVAHPSNIAVAVAIALELGVDESVIAAALPTLPAVSNRQAVTTLSTGATAIDDTFNSNPQGARAALAALRRMANPGHKVVVVTPGMIELGTKQREENAKFAATVASFASDLVVVGWTNRKALMEGVGAAARHGAGSLRTHLTDRREDAVNWVRMNTTTGDVVLYENDLPDHYP